MDTRALAGSKKNIPQQKLKLNTRETLKKYSLEMVKIDINNSKAIVQ